MRVVVAVYLFLIMALAHAGQPERIVTVGGALTEIVYSLGAESRLVGNDTTSYYPKQAEALPKVGYQRALSAEGILSLNPDMVILTDEAGPPAVINQIKSAGVDILELKAGRSLDDVKQSVQTIAKALGRERKAAALIKTLNKHQAQLVAAKQKTKAYKKVMFVLQHGGGAPMVAGVNTAADSIVKLSGGINAVTDYQGYKPLTPEAAVALNPDVILITKQGLEQAGGKEVLLKSPGLSLTHAAKQGHIIALDSLYMLGFGPRTVEAAIELNQAYGNL